MLCIVFRYYAASNNCEVLFSLSDLQKVTLRGDNIEGFQHSWVMVLSGLSKVPDLDVLEYCYFQQVKGFKPLSEDIAHYNREEEGSKDRSYEFLYDSVNKHLQRTGQHKMRDALSRGLAGSPTSPGASAPGKGKEGKGKERPCSRSAEAGKGLKACPFHTRGTCRDGKDCPMMHTGKPGAGGSSNGGSSKGSSKGSSNGQWSETC